MESVGFSNVFQDLAPFTSPATFYNRVFSSPGEAFYRHMRAYIFVLRTLIVVYFFSTSVPRVTTYFLYQLRHALGKAVPLFGNLSPANVSLKKKKAF
jgi:hypothetical protein